MPAPLQKMLSGRIVAGLIVLSIPLLLATGLVTVTWENGRPRFAVNHEKVKVVEEKAAEKIQELRAENNGSGLNAAGAIQALTGQSSAPTDSGWGQSQGVVSNLAEKVGNLNSNEASESGNSWSLLPNLGKQQNEAPAEKTGPLSSLRQRFDSRR